MNKSKKLIIGLGVCALIPLAAKVPGNIELQDTRTAAPSAVKLISGQKGESSPRALASSRVGKADIADYQGRRFMGGVVFMNSWDGMSITEVPYGLHEFTIGVDGTVVSESKVKIMSADWIASARLRDRYYGMRPIMMMGTLTSAAYHEIDLNAMAETRMVFKDQNVDFSLLPAAMFTDITDGELYAIMYNSDLTGLNIARFNPEDMAFEVTGRFGGQFNVLAIGSAPDGKIYLINPEGDLYTLNRLNGRVSLVGNTGVNVAAYTQAMAWDSKTGTFLWSAVTPTGSKLYAVDPWDASTKLVCNLGDGEQLSGMYLSEDGQMADAPKAVGDFRITYSSPGSQEATVDFTLPVAAGDGAAINGKLTVSLWRDGECLKDAEEMTPGQRVSIPVSLTNESHHYALSVANGKGYAPVATIYEWAGEDYPAAPGNVSLSVTDNVASLGWDAPAGSAHGGYMDPGEITYRVTRMPDNVVVAESQTGTTFTETLPEKVARYYYKVSAVNNGTKVGVAGESNQVVAGLAYDVPYAEDWQDGESARQLFTVVNNDGDGVTWQWADWNNKWLLFTPTDPGSFNDDWLISPKVRLEKGMVYKFVSNLRNSFVGHPESFAVYYGTDPEDLSTFTKVGEWSTSDAVDHDFEIPFQVEADGNFNIALVSTTDQGDGSSVVLNSIGVELIGNAGAPEAVTDFTVTRDANDLPEATLAFTAPVRLLNGGDIDGVFSINVYRDNERIGVIEDISAGQICEWKDSFNPPAGNRTYMLRCVNAAGEGMPASVTEFIGIYTAPWSEPCLTRDCLNDITFFTVGFEDDANYPSLSFNAYGDPQLNLSHFNQTTDRHDMYTVLPVMKFDDESVYSLRFDYKNMGYDNGQCVYSVNLGDAKTAEALEDNVIAILPNGTNYNFEAQDVEVVVTEGGKKYLAVVASSRKENDFTNINYKNFSLVRTGSALAPDSVSELRAASELTSKVSFKAPSTDMAGRPLADLASIEIYRNNQPVPAHVIEDPELGKDYEWIDDNALLGSNTYRIVTVNSHGNGRMSNVRCFIGYDTPAAPAGVSIVPTDDNQGAHISWDQVKRGVNGGVVSEDMTYIVVQLSTVDGENVVTPIAVGLTATEYDIIRTPTDMQQLLFYGVVAVAEQGVSEPSLYFTILGRPYELPFGESFANGGLGTSMWIALHPEGQLQSGPTVEEASVTMGVTPQDGDKGCFFFLNGALSDMRADIGVFSPKVALADAPDPEVSFWLYKGNHSGQYAENPKFSIYAIHNEGEPSLLGEVEWTENAPEWKRYSYSLNDYKGLPGTVMFQLVGSASGYLDFMAMDNFKVTARPGEDSVEDIASDGVSVFGVKGGLLTRGAAGCTVEVYDLAGAEVARYVSFDALYPIAPGAYVVKAAGRSVKVIVR